MLMCSLCGSFKSVIFSRSVLQDSDREEAEEILPETGAHFTTGKAWKTFSCWKYASGLQWDHVVLRHMCWYDRE